MQNIEVLISNHVPRKAMPDGPAAVQRRRLAPAATVRTQSSNQRLILNNRRSRTGYGRTVVCTIAIAFPVEESKTSMLSGSPTPGAMYPP